MPPSISRRSVLRLGLGSLGLFGAGGRLARLGLLNAQVADPSPDYKALVCIFLFGGNDANNLIVPVQTATQAYSAYHTIRGSGLALPLSNLAQFGTSSGDTYGLHPALSPLRSLYQKNRMAFVANVGTLLQPVTKQQYAQHQAAVPSNLFSHSDQQQQWQTTPGGRTGWGGRAADILEAANSPSTFPISLSTAGNALFLSGQTSTQAAITDGGLGLAGGTGSAAATARDNAFQQILTFDTGLSLIQTLNRYTAGGLQTGEVLTAALAGASAIKTIFPKTSLGQQLQQVAQIMNVRAALGMRRQIFFVSLGGFDTHTNQIPQQQALFLELAAALSAFDLSTLELGLNDRVVTFTESEFGRTCQPSTGAGSDHAWGGHHLVMSGALTAGDLYGTFPRLALGGPDDVGERGVWLPSTSLDQYAATLASWFGVPDASLPAVFPNLANFKTHKLGFLSSGSAVSPPA